MLFPGTGGHRNGQGYLNTHRFLIANENYIITVMSIIIFLIKFLLSSKAINYAYSLQLYQISFQYSIKLQLVHLFKTDPIMFIYIFYTLICCKTVYAMDMDSIANFMSILYIHIHFISA